MNLAFNHNIKSSDDIKNFEIYLILTRCHVWFIEQFMINLSLTAT